MTERVKEQETIINGQMKNLIIQLLSTKRNSSNNEVITRLERAFKLNQTDYYYEASLDAQIELLGKLNFMFQN